MLFLVERELNEETILMFSQLCLTDSYSSGLGGLLTCVQVFTHLHCAGRCLIHTLKRDHRNHCHLLECQNQSQKRRLCEEHYSFNPYRNE